MVRRRGGRRGRLDGERYLRVFKVVMADAAAQYRLTASPAARLRAIPERGEEELDSDDPVNLLTADEMTRFMAALKEGWPQWYAMAFTQFATASRFSEVSALRWEDIDEGRGIIRIRRGNGGRWCRRRRSIGGAGIRR